MTAQWPRPRVATGALPGALARGWARPFVRLFNPSAVVAILVFFAYALPCMSTAAAMHCDTVTRKWPAIACTCMLVTTWVTAAPHALVAVFI